MKAQKKKGCGYTGPTLQSQKKKFVKGTRARLGGRKSAQRKKSRRKLRLERRHMLPKDEGVHPEGSQCEKKRVGEKEINVACPRDSRSREHISNGEKGSPPNKRSCSQSKSERRSILQEKLYRVR